VPLYSFVCDKCRKYFEAIVPLKDYDKDVPCPYCKKKLKKLMNPVSFRMS
jgi:putative FmdB family regulatory protein